MKHIFSIFSLGFLVSVSVGLPAEDLHDILKNAAITINRTSLPDQEDARLAFEPLVRKYGYHVESHTVTTEDCYILTVHRIQNPKCTQENKPAVFMQHGILSSSFDWVIPGPGNSLAYNLADCCYDVWLGNFRGNTHSKKHCSLSPNKDKFWEFSYDEMGGKDLPACINYVLEKTGQKSLSYVGHSQGTTAFFVLCDKHSEVSEKVDAFVALAPVVFFKDCKSPLLNFMSSISDSLDIVLKIFGMNSFDPSNELIGQLGGRLCAAESKFSAICTNVLAILCGWNTDQLDPGLIPILMGHSPASCSTMQLMHYAQGMKSNKFRKYDHGLIENLIRYGSILPPAYDLSKVNAPTYFLCGDKDIFAELSDVFHLWSLLPQIVKKELYPIPNFSHLDFMFAKDQKILVNDKVVDIINQANGRDCCNC